MNTDALIQAALDEDLGAAGDITSASTIPAETEVTAEMVARAPGIVAGVDVARESEIQGEIMREGLMTGRRIERQSMSGVRPGVELRPHIVVTVKFEGVVKDSTTGEIKLRDPKLVYIRSDKTALEADTTQALEELLLKARVS